LDAPSFAARERAARELRQSADGAEAVLREALGGELPAESRRRVEQILAGLDEPAGGRLPDVRAVEVLERVGSPDAKGLLKRLADGAGGERLTREAAGSLVRVEGR
jgi:hypothetical protein